MVDFRRTPLVVTESLARNAQSWMGEPISVFSHRAFMRCFFWPIVPFLYVPGVRHS